MITGSLIVTDNGSAPKSTDVNGALIDTYTTSGSTVTWSLTPERE